ncbi:hypothetical protein ACPCTO_20885 [Streptomyces olivoreticuli]
MSAEQLLLTDEEVQLLRKGLMEWSGPARCTEEFALAMGFVSALDLPERCSDIRSALTAGDSIDPMDWARILLATEIAFASDVVGSGYEWSTTTGWSDEVTIKTLRAIQRKLVRVVSPLIGNGLGTRPSEF